MTSTRTNRNIDSRNGAAPSGSRFTFQKRSSPFTRAIMAEFVKMDFQIPPLPKFEGKGDSQEHVLAFWTTMQLYNLTDALNCKVFITTLTGRALTWFTQLEAESVHSYQQLIDKFQAYFIGSRRFSKSAALFYQIKQREGESLRKFMTRFNYEKLNVPDLTINMINHILVHGLKPGRLLSSIVTDPPANMDSLLKETERCINEEEVIKMWQDGHKGSRREDWRPVKERLGGRGARQASPPCRYADYHPLNVSITTVLKEIKGKFDLNYPRKMKNANIRLNSDKYCKFHQDKGHDTEDCRHLRIEIERLIRKGYLTEFLESMQGRMDEGPRRSPTRSPGRMYQSSVVRSPVRKRQRSPSPNERRRNNRRVPDLGGGSRGKLVGTIAGDSVG